MVPSRHSIKQITHSLLGGNIESEEWGNNRKRERERERKKDRKIEREIERKRKVSFQNQVKCPNKTKRLK